MSVIFCWVVVSKSWNFVLISFNVLTVPARSRIWLPKDATLFDNPFMVFGTFVSSGAAWSDSWTCPSPCWIPDSYVTRNMYDYWICLYERIMNQVLNTWMVKLFIWNFSSDNWVNMVLWLFCSSLDKEWHFCKASGTPSFPALTATKFTSLNK